MTKKTLIPFKKHGSSEVIKRANKSHMCHICGCNIEKGQQYIYEKVYIPVTYDYYEDDQRGGYFTVFRNHVHRAACELAISKEKQAVSDYMNILKLS